MKLVKISYKDTNWELQDLELGTLNLVLGRNGTGKTRTLQTIDLLVKMLTQRRNMNWGGEWDIEFLNQKGQAIRYQFSTSSKKLGVSFEKMMVDGKVVIDRKRNVEKAWIANQMEGGRMEGIYPPDNKLILHTHRDVKKYPYLEDIAAWAESSFGFKFGNISPYARLNSQEYELLTAVEDIPNLYKSLGEAGRKTVLEHFNATGYTVSQISVKQNGEPDILYVKEEGLQKEIPHYRLSQGMFRAIALIIYIEYLKSRRKPATIIVDDLCEGLDFERATKLGRIIFELCEKAEIQLIATSNDYFLMEVVDIKFWNILSREGKIVSGLAKEEKAELIQKFRFTGLSNFDFFASDFIAKQQ